MQVIIAVPIYQSSRNLFTYRDLRQLSRGKVFILPKALAIHVAIEWVI